jgi:hypothetical protein
MMIRGVQNTAQTMEIGRSGDSSFSFTESIQTSSLVQKMN